MRNRPLAAALTAAAALAATSSPAPAQPIQTMHWINPKGGLWSTAANWDPANVPDTTFERAVIQTPGAYTVTASSDLYARAVSVLNPDATLRILPGGHLRLVLNEPLVVDGTIELHDGMAGSTSPAQLTVTAIEGTGAIRLRSPAGNPRAIINMSSVNQVPISPGVTISGSGELWGPFHHNGTIVAEVGERVRVANMYGPAVQGPQGRLLANGGTVQITGALNGGSLEAVNGGLIRLSDTAHLTDVSISGPVMVDGWAVSISGAPVENNDLITLGEFGGTTLRFPTGLTLTGSGALRLHSQHNSPGTLQCDGPLTNSASHTIFGAGTIRGSLVNHGLILANIPGPGRNIEFRANLPGNHSIVQGTTGELRADGAGLHFACDLVAGGSIRAVNGGNILITRAVLSDLHLSGDVHLGHNSILSIAAPGISTDAVIDAVPGSRIHVLSDAAVTGPGTFSFPLISTRPRITVSPGATLVHGHEHTIIGAWELSGNIENHGRIIGTHPGYRLAFLDGAITQGPTGRIIADNGQVDVMSSSLSGGSLESVGTGEIAIFPSLTSLSNVALSGQVLFTSSMTVDYHGPVLETITDSRISAGTFANVVIRFTEPVTLDGAGSLRLRRLAAFSPVFRAAAGGSITNAPGHTLVGVAILEGPFVNHGVLLVGNGHASGLQFSGPLTLSSSSRIDAGFLSPPSGIIQAFGPLHVDGTLAVRFPEGVIVPLGVNGPIMVGAPITGRFTAFDSPPTNTPGQVWCIQYSSTEVRVRVSCRPDINCDGLTNSADITDFLQRWLASITDGTLDADFNADGAVTPADITAFLASWLGVLGDGGDC